jgi:DNA-binding FrmR family transcriptional regulator
MANKHANSDDVISRLRKIGGHVHGVAKMVEEEKSCDEILLQISAIRAALSKVGQIVLADHIEECIVHKIDDEAVKAEIRHFTAALSRLIR